MGVDGLAAVYGTDDELPDSSEYPRVPTRSSVAPPASTSGSQGLGHRRVAYDEAEGDRKGVATSLTIAGPGLGRPRLSMIANRENA